MDRLGPNPPTAAARSARWVLLVLQVVAMASGFSTRASMHTKGCVHVCTNTSCRKAGSRGTLETFRAFAPAGVEVIETGCQGRCGLGPNILTTPSEELYNGVAAPATVAAIVEIDFGFPVADTLVGAFSHVSEGDKFFKRGLFAEAMKRYTQCVDTAGAFEGNANALSVAKVKQSSAMRMAAKEEEGKRRGSAAAAAATPSSVSSSLEEAEAFAREAVELWPAHTAAWLNLCDVLVDHGKVPEALETLAALKKDFPDAKFEASEKAARIRNTQY